MTSRLSEPVNGFGFYFATTTWARHARAFFTALHRLRPVKMYPLDMPLEAVNLKMEAAALLGETRSMDPSAMGVGIGPIECMSSVQGRKRIAFVVWETTVLPEEKLEVLRGLDEIWTPSQWSRKILVENGLDRERVFVVPEGVDATTFLPLPETRRRQDGTFRFLCVGKWEVRKGVEELVECFAEEFGYEEDVELVLHAFNPWIPNFDLEHRIAQVLRGRHARVIANQPVGEEELCGLYNSCDAFVLPTKGEGWGLPIMEAMACGLPVIATDYSAPADFLNERVAYPLRVERMVDVHDPYFFPGNPIYGQWAQPDLTELRRLMRHVMTNRDEAAAKGKLAREAVCDHWTWDHAARTADGLLRRG